MLPVVRYLKLGAAQVLTASLLGSVALFGCSLKTASKGTTLSLVLPNPGGHGLVSRSSPRFGVAPATWDTTGVGGFQCYGVNVIGPGIADSSTNPKTPMTDFSELIAGTKACSYRGVVSNSFTFPAGGADVQIDVQVPAGADRIVQLIGITDSNFCSGGFLQPISGSTPGAYEIGHVVADLFGDATVTVPITYTGLAAQRVDCMNGVPVTVLNTPIITYSGITPFTNGSAISLISPSNTGGAITSCSISPALPAGLFFDTSNCEISGTPTAVSATANYTVIASSVDGPAAGVAISITVNDIVPVISLAGSPFIYTKNSAITALAVSNTGGAITSCSISSALPTGLSFNTSTCGISGSPSVLSAATNYTITALNSGGASAGVVISITVNDVAPAISFTGSPFVYTKNSPITALTVSNTGGAITSCSISSALPSGLTFNTSTCAISGTPTISSPAQAYTITATNTGGASAPVISIEVVIPAPTGLSLSSPATSPNNVPTPSILVSGTRSGETVGLFTDSACTAGVASGVASGTTIVLTSSILADGSYTFYANATDAGANTSPCSTAMVNDLINTTAPTIGSFSVTNTSPTFTQIFSLSVGGLSSYTEYCILENDTNVANCSFVPAAVPSTFTVSPTSGSYILTLWTKNTYGTVSAPFSATSVTYDNACDTMAGNGASVGTAYVIDTPTRFKDCLPIKDGAGVYFQMPSASVLDMSSLSGSIPALYGILDGQGTKIQNMNISSGSGLFAIIDGGQVHNLIIDSPILTCATYPCGVLAGLAQNGALVDHVHLVGTTLLNIGSATAGAGGLVGKAIGDSHFVGNFVAGLTIGATSSASSVGGLVGAFEKSSSTAAPDFFQNRVILSQFAAGQCASDAGGLVGTVSAMAASTVILLDQNSIDFDMPCTTASGASRVGGAVGGLRNGASGNTGVIFNLKNFNVRGDLTSATGNSWYGGIVGINTSQSTDTINIISSYYGGVMNVAASGSAIGAIMPVNTTPMPTIYFNDDVWLQATSYVANASSMGSPTTSTGTASYSFTALTTGSSPYPVSTDWYNTSIWNNPGSALPKLAYEGSFGIELAGVASANNGTGTTNLLIAKPAGTIASRVMVAGITTRPSTTTITTPSGWTLLQSQATGNIRQSTYYRVAQTADDSVGDYTWTLSVSAKASGVIITYDGVDSSAPVLASDGLATAVSATITAPSLTTAATEFQSVVFYGIASDSLITPPVGYATLGENASTGGAATTKTRTLVAHKRYTTSGATGAITATTTATDNVGQHVLLKRAP